MTDRGATAGPPPSRDANPFATCWTRPGALPWFGDVDAVVGRLRSADWRGQIVGPHGSGKSTLLRSLLEPLRAAGQRPVLVDALQGTQANDGLLLVEAFERLPRREQSKRIAAWRREGVPFVVTTHRVLRSRPATLPVVEHTAPSEAVLGRLFAELTRRRATPVTLEDAFSRFASRAGDVRETLFDLYNLHEERSRRGRTPVAVVAYRGRRHASQESGVSDF